MRQFRFVHVGQASLPKTSVSAPTQSAESRNFVGDRDRFRRLMGAFIGDAVVQSTLAEAQRSLDPPAVIDDVLQARTAAFVEPFKEQAATAVGSAFYSSMRLGWSTAVAVLAARGKDLSNVDPDRDAAGWFERLEPMAERWYETKIADEMSDLAYYIIDNLTPSVKSYVRDALRTAMPSDFDVAGNWESSEAGGALLRMGESSMLFGVAAALAVADLEIL